MRVNLRVLRALLVAVAALASAGVVQALCLGPLCSCSASTAPVTFGAVNPLAAGPSDSTGQVRVSCGGVAGLLIPYRIALSGGGGPSIGARRLTSGANSLAYGLFADPARLVTWGDASGGTVVSGSILLDVLGLSPTVTHTVYGRIPAGQNSAIPGSYVDTITVTVTYD
ncbi:MAG TPA: spore coat U domain-containing protein [Methylibium sp.]|uniref:Csu type fimbrial protein n=1 Tax=Methylibium sp. TaxID=2067992 RepID=UPI002DBCB05B|nr:spore coat U domain-containing protein [Methylibium sp.]HEU4459918.1 spore coat U domain-containing protein [Methylibium sp.]